MKSNLALLTYFLCASVSACVPSHETTKLSFKKHEKNKMSDDCIKILVNIQKLPLVTTNCCLTMLCSNHRILKQITRDHPAIKELTYELCGRNFYLVRELLAGCVFKNNQNNDVNNTNSMTIELNNQSLTHIANCSVKFQLPTVNRETKEINSEITDDFEKRSMETSTGSLQQHPRFSQNKAENFRTGDGRIRFGNITETAARISKLQFLDVPRGDEMRIHDLKLDREYLIFEAFSVLMTYLQPSEFPLGKLPEAQLAKSTFSSLVLLSGNSLQVLHQFENLTLDFIPFSGVLHYCCLQTNQ